LGTKIRRYGLTKSTANCPFLFPVSWWSLSGGLVGTSDKSRALYKTARRIFITRAMRDPYVLSRSLLELKILMSFRVLKSMSTNIIHNRYQMRNDYNATSFELQVRISVSQDLLGDYRYERMPEWPNMPKCWGIRVGVGWRWWTPKTRCISSAAGSTRNLSMKGMCIRLIVTEGRSGEQPQLELYTGVRKICTRELARLDIGQSRYRTTSRLG